MQWVIEPILADPESSAQTTNKDMTYLIDDLGLIQRDHETGTAIANPIQFDDLSYQLNT